LSQKVSLLNKVLKVKNIIKVINYSDIIENLSECYKNNQFDYIINHYDLGDHRNLMKELLSQLPYHFLEFVSIYELP